MEYKEYQDHLIQKATYYAYCKICEKDFPVLKYTRASICNTCNKYKVTYTTSPLPNGEPYIESETIFIDNFYFIYSREFKQAFVVQKAGDDKEDRHILSDFIEIEELTHELAIHWIEKLKTYVIFQ
jgi:hypothetical protein